MDLQAFTALLHHVKGGPAQFTARCPAHEDHSNSLSVGTGKDGRILLHCHAGCSLDEILVALSLQRGDLFPGRNSASSRSEHANLQPERARSETKMQTCKKPVKKQVVYLYTDAENRPLFEVVRQQNEDGSKSFRQRQRVNGKLVYHLQGVEPVLYKLPLVRKEITEGRGIVAICEGEKDADRLLALGITATTAPMGAGKWRPQYSESLKDAVKVYALPDNDRAGRGHALKIAEELTGFGVDVEIVDLKRLDAELSTKGDVSDVLDHLGDDAAKRLFANTLRYEDFRAVCDERDAEDALPPYRFERVSGYLQTGFLQELRQGAASGPALTTGFAGLDRQLDGHLFPGLYVVGSVSSLGKTAFCLQIADHLAKQGADVLFFTLEMSRLEMVARSLVRTLFTKSRCTAQYSVGDLLYGKVPPEEQAAAVDAYTQAGAQKLAHIEGDTGLTVDAVCELALKHQKATGNSPVVFVDYLQILAQPDVRMSDKQAMDYAVVALKRLSRQLQSPVVAVSSFNRQNYSEEVNLASFKESGAIEYSADVVLGLQARGISDGAKGNVSDERAARMVADATKRAKQQDPRPIEAVTLKNRRGPAWACFGLDFYPRQNLFVETNV